MYTPKTIVHLIIQSNGIKLKATSNCSKQLVSINSVIKHSVAIKIHSGFTKTLNKNTNLLYLWSSQKSYNPLFLIIILIALSINKIQNPNSLLVNHSSTTTAAYYHVPPYHSLARENYNCAQQLYQHHLVVKYHVKLIVSIVKPPDRNHRYDVTCEIRVTILCCTRSMSLFLIFYFLNE